MADLRLTKDKDRYVQPESERNNWNTIWGEEGDDHISLYQGTVVGGPGNDVIEQLVYPGETGRTLSVAFWNSPGATVVNFAEGWAEDGWGGRDTLIGKFSSFHGNGYSNTVIGSDLSESVYLFAGRDYFNGGKGYDVVNIADFWVNGRQVFYTRDDLNITVSADGLRAVVETKAGLPSWVPYLRYELEHVEALRFYSEGWKYVSTLALSDLVTPELTAQQTIAAGASFRHDTSLPLGSAQTITFSFMTLATSGTDANAPGFRVFSEYEKALVRDIFAKTSTIVGLTFQEITESGATQGQIRFGVTQQADTKGYTILPGTTGAGSKAGDILMDVDSMLDIRVGSEGYEALLHEIGHALGLRHPRNIDAADQWSVQSLELYNSRAMTVMATIDSQDGLFRSTWGPLDWAALQHLYGAKPVQTADNTYLLKPSSFDARMTIVDHGGTDTLDASWSPVGVYLDLNAGAVSSVGMTSSGRAGSQNIALGVDTQIENAKGTVFDDVLIGNALDNRFWALSGNDWVDGGAGYDTVIFSADASEYSLAMSSGSLTLESIQGVKGFITLSGVESLVFDNKAISLQTSSHDSYSDLPADLYLYFVVTLQAAPGVTHMNQLAALSRSGYSVKQIVDALVAKPEFTNTYPIGLSHLAFAERLVENTFGEDASSATKSAAVLDIKRALDDGGSRGEVIHAYFGNLARKPIDDPVWGGTVKLFQNQVTVAKHFTETLDFSTTDLTTLRDALGEVTSKSSVGSANIMTQLIADGLMKGSTSQTMSTYFGTEGDDTWTIQWAAVITIDGLGGADTLRLGTSKRTDYLITEAEDGAILVESVSRASAPFKGKLYNIEKLVFDNGKDVMELTQGSGLNKVQGDGINALLSGTEAADHLIGTSIDERLVGGLGNDLLDGGGGADEMSGGAGYDRYVLNQVGDRVIELAETPPAGVDVSVLERDIFLRLQQFYIAYYGRPADYAGSVYWVNTLEREFKGSQTGMVAAFGNLQQKEYVDLYGTGGTVQEFLTRVYQNLFNRAPDQEGLNYWTGIINARADQVGIGQARSESVIQILDGAQAADRLVVQAKQTVATQFSQQVSLLDSANEYGTASNALLFASVRAWFSQVDATTTDKVSTAQMKAAAVAAVELSGTRLGDSLTTTVDWSRTAEAELTADIEHFFAAGSSAIRLVGDDQTNILSGNGYGTSLTGGAGADVFWFDEKSVTTPDRILDFNPDEDLIGLDSRLFSGLTKGPLSQEAFDANFRFDGQTLYLGNQPVYEITLTSGSFSYSDIWVF
jgi:serralysin